MWHTTYLLPRDSGLPRASCLSDSTWRNENTTCTNENKNIKGLSKSCITAGLNQIFLKFWNGMHSFAKDC